MTRRRPRSTAIEAMLLTFSEACEYLRVGETWLKQHKNEIGYIGGGKFLRFERAALDAWIARHRTAPRTEDAATPAKVSARPVRLVARSEGTNPVTGKPWGYYDDLAAGR